MPGGRLDNRRAVQTVEDLEAIAALPGESGHRVRDGRNLPGTEDLRVAGQDLLGERRS